ncbi:transferase [candidate division KSB1 bacterium]|nr:transferase [candidate division KSB1 bacterium]
MNRYLITTADERSWKFDCPVLFLGEWCRRYDRKHVWSEMDAIVADPFGLEPNQKSRDIGYINAFAGQILTELTEALNKFHQTQHCERYWNIVLGHWLQRYVAVAFNRYHTLDQALKTHEVAGTTVFEANDYSLATTDSLSFSRACNDDAWNHVLYAKILNFFGNIKMELDTVPLRGISGFAQEMKPEAAGRTISKRFLWNVANNILPKFSRKRDAFIINSYLPKIEEAKLQIRLGQCPQFWQSPVMQSLAINQEKRMRFSIDAENHRGFEQFVRSELSETIPICYLEGYDQLIQQVKSLPWPVDPRFIFTSNNFDTDEIFKVWTALKVEEGCLYFTGQHGNNYRTLLGSMNSPEITTADKFISWGWTGGVNNIVPGFIIKTVGYDPCVFDPKGGVLLIEVHVSHLNDPNDSYYEFGLYQEDQFRFVESLPKHIHRELIVRLYPSFMRRNWFDEQRWKDRSSNTKLETGVTSIKKLTAQSRLVVHSYDSTGILETLSLNIPTMCFWRNGLNHLLPNAKPYYELLRGAGILHDTPEHTAEFIASNWDRIGEWWGSEKVQGARKAFCGQYARTEKHPIRALKKLLTQEAKRT